MKRELIFSIKVWQTAVFVAPVLLLVTGTLDTNGTFDDFIQFVTTAALFGSAFSLPSALLLFVSTRLILIKTNLHMVAVKLVLSGIGVILTIAPAVVFIGNGTMNNQETKITMAYALTIAAAIWLYKLRRASIEDIDPKKIVFDGRFKRVVTR